MTTNTTATKAGHLLDWRELAPVAALLRTHECFADDEDTDIGRDKLDALTAFGWLEKVGRAKWMITALGERIVDRALTTPPAEPASAAEDAKPAAWVTPLHYGEQVTFYKPPAPAPGEDDEWYCYPLFRHPAPSACGVADSAAEGCLCQGCGNRYRGDLEVPDDVWLNGTAGNCNIVTYNGEDVVGVGYIANDNAREQVIADHNARLDAQPADTPSEAPVAWQRRCDGGEWLQCSREQYEHTVRRGNAGVVGDNAEARALYALRQQPARCEVSEAEVEAALLASDAVIPGTRAGGGIEMGRREREMRSTAMRAALEAAARVRADHFVDANKIEGDAK